MTPRTDIRVRIAPVARGASLVYKPVPEAVVEAAGLSADHTIEFELESLTAS